MGAESRIELSDGTSLKYDALILNVGSKTFGTKTIPGVSEYALTTRPINHLIPKIERKEQELKE